MLWSLVGLALQPAESDSDDYRKAPLAWQHKFMISRFINDIQFFVVGFVLLFAINQHPEKFQDPRPKKAGKWNGSRKGKRQQPSRWRAFAAAEGLPQSKTPNEFRGQWRLEGLPFPASFQDAQDFWMHFPASRGRGTRLIFQCRFATLSLYPLQTSRNHKRLPEATLKHRRVDQN